MFSVRSATFGAHRVPSQGGPSPRAAGPHFYLGGCGRGLSALPSPGRIVGSYSSFQPSSGLAPGVLRHHGAAGPSALPMIAESGTPARGRPTRSRWLETALFTAMAGNANLP